jgi:hypothetical protein
MPKLLYAMKNMKLYPKSIRQAIKQAKRQLKEVITDDILLRSILTNIVVRNNGMIGWACNLDIIIKQLKQIESFPKDFKGKLYMGPVIFIGGQFSDYIPYVCKSFVVTFLYSLIHRCHSRLIPEGVAEASRIFLRETHVLLKLFSYE